uniref:MPN domain-containing protein n=1 Tax=Mesocestoides corti TaxID=53468 RepID=A0A5K3ES82_MESCO
MGTFVKLTPSAYHAMMLHFGIDVSREMKGILFSPPNTFVVTIIPLSSVNPDTNLTSIDARCKELSRLAGTQLTVVGWYHSHVKKCLQPTEEDLDFQLKLQATIPHSVAVVASFGGPSEDMMAKVTSLSAFRCSPEGKPIPVDCLVRPLLPSPSSSKYYELACCSLEDVLMAAQEYTLSQETPKASVKLDSYILAPILANIHSMMKSLEVGISRRNAV